MQPNLDLFIGEQSQVGDSFGLGPLAALYSLSAVIGLSRTGDIHSSPFTTKEGAPSSMERSYSGMDVGIDIYF